jgi:hypothetical protein
MHFRKIRFTAAITLILACSALSPADERRWINPNGGLISEPSNWTPTGDPEFDDLRFYVGPTFNDTYTVYVDPPNPHDPGRYNIIAVQDYVTFDFLGGDIIVATRITTGSGGGHVAASRTLTLINNSGSGGELTTKDAMISGLSVGRGVHVEIERDITAMHTSVPVNLNITNGGTMTVVPEFFPSGIGIGSNISVSGPGSQLTVYGGMAGMEGPAGEYPMRAENEGVFEIVGNANGGGSPLGIHLSNGILIADRISNRPIRGYGLVSLVNNRERLDPSLEIWNPLGRVSIARDIEVTGNAAFLSIGPAEYSGIATFGPDSLLESPTGVRLVGGEIRSNPGVAHNADIDGDVFVENGVIDVQSGDLRIGRTSGYGVVIGDGPTFDSIDGTVALDRDIHIDARDAVVHSLDTATLAGSVTLGGGTLTAANGLQITETATLLGHGTVAAAMTAEPGSAIQAATSLLTLGDPAEFIGFATQGAVVVESGATLNLHSASFAALGPLTTLHGGTLQAANGVVLGAGDNLVGTGAADCRIAAGLGSTIAASGDLELGDSSALNGFASSGNLAIGAHTVTIHDANQGVLGSLTTLNGGQLAAPNGILLRQGDNISGNGLISADLTSGGYVFGDPAGLELSGYVNGPGQFDGSVTFTGTYDPGSSPTIAYHEDSTFGDSSTLLIELGGLVSGSQHDKIVADSLSLDGTLLVSLINGFVPQLGDSFDILDFNAIASGTSATVSLPELTGRNSWDASSLYTDGLIVVVAMLDGDTDNDRDVDTDDYNAFVAVFGDTGDRWTDFNSDGLVDLTDFVMLRENFGTDIFGVSAMEAKLSTPEPGTLILLLTCGSALVKLRRKPID